MYPLAIFKNKISRYIGLIISSLLIIILTVLCMINPPIYSTDILVNDGEYQFNDSYKVYLVDKKYGNLSIKYEDGIEDWIVHADFKKAGKTEFIIESPDGKKILYDISIRSDKYTIKKKR